MRTDSSVTVREAEPTELDRVAELLKANGLPHSDLRASPGQFFVGRAEGNVVAAGGVELYGPNALVRSVVVAEPHRSAGYGTVLCDELEEFAVEEGADSLYLLTTTAADFFRERGFEVTARAAVPARIRETTLFADHCPRSATCMEKPGG